MCFKPQQEKQIWPFINQKFTVTCQDAGAMLFSGHFCSLSSSCLENLSIPAKGLNAIFPAHRFPAKLGGQDILPALQQGGSWFPAASIHVENTAQRWKWKTGSLLPQKPICAFPWQPRTECSGGDRFVFTLARLVSSSEDNAPADTVPPRQLHPAYIQLLRCSDGTTSLINPLLLFDDFHHNRAGPFSSSPSRVFLFCRVCF